MSGVGNSDITVGSSFQRPKTVAEVKMKIFRQVAWNKPGKQQTIWYRYLELYLQQLVSTLNINRKSKQVRSIQILFLQYVQD